MSARTTLFDRSVLRAALLLVALAYLLPIARAQQEVSPYAGEWRGTIAPVELYGLSGDVIQELRLESWSEPREFLIDISRAWGIAVYVPQPRNPRSRQATAWRRQEFSWVSNQLGGDGLVVYTHITNSCCTHVYVFNIARIGQDSLLVQWSWVGNDRRSDPGEDVSRWAAVGQGEFKRQGRR